MCPRIPWCDDSECGNYNSYDGDGENVESDHCSDIEEDDHVNGEHKELAGNCILDIVSSTIEYGFTETDIILESLQRRAYTGKGHRGPGNTLFRARVLCWSTDFSDCLLVALRSTGIYQDTHPILKQLMQASDLCRKFTNDGAVEGPRKGGAALVTI